MCVAILTKPGSVVTNDRLYAGWCANNDGGGFAYAHNGKTVIRKGFLKYGEFQKAYSAAAEKYSESSPFLVHMRIATSGGITSKNCHPFKVADGAVIHNGILFTPTGKMAESGKSDTRIFAEKYHNILHLEDVLKAENAILTAFGHANKLAFLYSDARYVIINEKAGMWIDDIWYSNSTCTVRWKITENRHG